MLHSSVARFACRKNGGRLSLTNELPFLPLLSFSGGTVAKLKGKNDYESSRCIVLVKVNGIPALQERTRSSLLNEILNGIYVGILEMAI